MSVRPATVSSTGSRRTVASAVSSSPWTVRRPGWRAQPRKPAPSYSISSLTVGTAAVSPTPGRRAPHLESSPCASSSPTTTASPPRGCRPPGGRWSSSRASRSTSIAPDSNRSATARSITTRSPLSGRGGQLRATAASATPPTAPRSTASASPSSGCVGGRPDLIVSGINHGANLGDDITYSGTVAAALEGIVLGIPAIAVSQQSSAGGLGYVSGQIRLRASPPPSPRSWSRGCGEEPMPEATLINVNCPCREPTGIEVTKLGKRIYNDELKLVERRRRPPPLRDLRLAARLRGDRGNRPPRGRRGADLGHPDPLRPHRPRRASSGCAAGASRRCWRRAPRRRERSRRAARRGAAASSSRTTTTSTTSSTTPRSATTTTTRCSTSCARSRTSTRSCARPTRRPSGSGRRRWTASSRSSTPSRCSRSATPATRRSCAAWENRIANYLKRLDITASRVQLHDRAEDRRPRRSPSPTRTGCWSAAPPAATAGSART